MTSSGSGYGSAYEVTAVQRGDEFDIVRISMPKHERSFRVTLRANDSDRVVEVEEMTSGRAKAIKSRPTREHIMEIAQLHLRKNPRPPDDED